MRDYELLSIDKVCYELFIEIIVFSLTSHKRTVGAG